MAAVHGNIKAIALLRKALKFVKYRQGLLLFQQKMLLARGQKVKRETLRDFRRLLKGLKTKNLREDTSLKKSSGCEAEKDW